jgi:GNAT superfamily N-acetyltransferase
VSAMAAIQKLLEGPRLPHALVLRPPHSGDFGWVVHRHGVNYAQEYGWDETFEALVARIVADFADARDPRREAAWIAELDGDTVGCVFCVKKEESVAQLRLLLVEPRARGKGVGTRLCDQCVRFARSAGYKRLMLWTNDVLEDARRIYERAGFELVEEERHRSFGHDLVGQNWWLTL